MRFYKKNVKRFSIDSPLLLFTQKRIRGSLSNLLQTLPTYYPENG